MEPRNLKNCIYKPVPRESRWNQLPCQHGAQANTAHQTPRTVIYWLVPANGGKNQEVTQKCEKRRKNSDELIKECRRNQISYKGKGLMNRFEINNPKDRRGLPTPHCDSSSPSGTFETPWNVGLSLVCSTHMPAICEGIRTRPFAAFKH